MQRIADQVPGGVVEIRTSDAPYIECSDAGYNYVARWSVVPGADFDGRSFVETVPVSAPAVALDLDILGISTCGEGPLPLET